MNINILKIRSSENKSMLFEVGKKDVKKIERMSELCVKVFLENGEILTFCNCSYVTYES